MTGGGKTTKARTNAVLQGNYSFYGGLVGSINDRWGQNDESQDQCSFAGKLQAAGK